MKVGAGGNEGMAGLRPSSRMLDALDI